MTSIGPSRTRRMEQLPPVTLDRQAHLGRRRKVCLSGAEAAEHVTGWTPGMVIVMKYLRRREDKHVVRNPWELCS